MINLNNLTMGFSKRTLFEGVTFSIFPKEKIGLTGPNGAGKTTLFSIILGSIEPVAGQVQVQKNINVGYLPQESKFSSTHTVMEEITSGDDRIKKLVAEKHKLEDEDKVISDRYSDVLTELEQLGIYELEHKAEKVLTGLGFKEEEFHKPIVQLSGGWQMRTLLAKLLTYSYDLLLLDEPTNYLDLNATLWLKEYLKNYQGAFVLISHDRFFLNEVTNYTIVLEQQGMTKIKGNYEEYEQRKAMNQQSLEKRKKVVDKKREQLERFAQRFHAQPNKAAAVKNKRKMIDKLEDIDLDRESSSMGDFSFDDVPESGYVVATGTNLHKAYDDKVVYEGLDLEIVRGQKICLVGPNGAGKSTLLKMLSGAIEPDQGKVKLGHNVERGYFSQTRTDVLQPSRTVLEELSAATTKSIPATKLRTLLGLFSFRGDDVFKIVKVLSGGEKSRLILAKLLINPPNFMLLDEPTTHLDLDGVKALTGAFQKFEETMCFISHDLYFIREVADYIIEVNDGKIQTFHGGLEYYLYKNEGKDQEADQIKKKKKQQASANKSNKQGADANGKPEEGDKFSNLHKQHKQAKKRLSQIKTEIRNLEQED
ncbi:MAG: ATP-binding cassette subfamily F protein 3, partial [Candidatus Omnitrophota bacterium]